ncbi:MAG: hypothetical protein AB8B62_16195 [Roseobacter sp.]
MIDKRVWRKASKPVSGARACLCTAGFHTRVQLRITNAAHIPQCFEHRDIQILPMRIVTGFKEIHHSVRIT